MKRDIVVIGASAGGIEAIRTIVRALPADLPAALFIVVHTRPESPGYLAEILTRTGPLPARSAVNGDVFAHGSIYVAPPDHHLILQPDRSMQVVRGPRENRTRPAADPLFRSAALSFGPAVIGIVLSGGLDDGTAGLRGIKMCGGTTIVQNPDDALVDSMPRSAIRNVSIDYCRPAHELSELIVQLVTTEIADQPTKLEKSMKKRLALEVEIAKGQGGMAIKEFGDPSLFTCPECHGALMKLRDDKPLRFRCHTGHAFTADSLLAELSEATEEAIWSTIRSIQEGATLMAHLADHWRETAPDVADRFERRAEVALSRADHLRQVAAGHEAVSKEKVEQES